jgi:DNA repair exonuclease SbcCD nuclease subunit
MRTLFVSDLHASLSLPLARPDHGKVHSDRLRDVLGIIERLGDYAEEVSARAVFVAGDLFDAQHPDGATLVHTAGALAQLAARVPVYLLPGNHDAIDRDGRMYSLQMYSELQVPGLTVLGQGDVVEVAEGARVHAVPWLPDARARKRIRGIGERLGSDVDVLLFHQGVLGAAWDSGRASDEGLDPAEILDVRWAHAVTGHYHRPQTWGDRGRYLGAPLDLRFGDEEVAARGWWELDWESNAWTLVPSRAPRFRTERFRLEPGTSFLDHGVEEDGTFPADVQYLRLVIEGPADVIEKERKILQEIADRRMGGRVRAIKLDLRPDRKDSSRLEIDSSLSLPEMARRYVAKFAPEDMDPDHLIGVGLPFLEGA